MNKRLEKIVNRIKEGNVKGAIRRDQIKKAVEESGFDYMIYRGYDEVYDVEPVKSEAKVENIKDYWWRGADLWANVKNTDEKEILVVTMKYGYSYIDLYVEINKEENIKIENEKELININDEDVEVTYNEEKNGIEIKFNEKPETEVLSQLKENGFRWHRIKKVWYAKDTEERRSFINSLIGDEDPTMEENEELINVKDFNNIETLKDNYVTNWSELPVELQEFILTCDSYNIINLQECLLYKNNECVASLGINVVEFKNIEIESAGAGELFQWSLAKGFTANNLIKSDNKINFDNVIAEEVKEDIFVKALIPHINKNDSIELNNEEIKEGSELSLFKVSHIIELSDEQYNYFINNLLDDYKFLQGLGGWSVDDNGKFESYLGVIITCENKETLLVDPSGSSYARYLNKIVEDIDGNLNNKINVVLDNKLYKEAYEDINNSALYIVNFAKKRVIKDKRVILNGAFNDIQVVTGLTVKEMINESTGINILNLEEYKGNLNTFKEGLERVDNGLIINLIPTEIDKELNKIKMVDRLESELTRSLNN